MKNKPSLYKKQELIINPYYTTGFIIIFFLAFLLIGFALNSHDINNFIAML